MIRKNGFTLTEVLLAVMIVALIGVALASLTSAASRESALANSRVILRNNLSSALRQIRRDIQSTPQIFSDTSAYEGAVSGTVIKLVSFIPEVNPDHRIDYCFTVGSTEALPNYADAQRSFSGGVIHRVEYQDTDEHACPTADGTGYIRTELLNDVKFIPAGGTLNYQVPFFTKIGAGGVLVRIITEAPHSRPLANVAAEEVFFGPGD